jgi:membrane protease YdiL (CAAX protease family)
VNTLAIETETVAAWLAFLAGSLVSLPWPPDLRLLALAAVAGAVICVLGSAAAARSRGRLPRNAPTRRWKLGLLAGALGAALGLVLLAALVSLARFEPALAARFAGRLAEPAWRPWALALEASTLEEIVFRLFLLSGVAWLAACFVAARSGAARAPFLVALAVSSLAFGLAHLPSWLAVTALTPPLVAGVLALNGVGGLLFGGIFWRWGLPYAVLSHFAGDVVVQSLAPRLLS